MDDPRRLWWMTTFAVVSALALAITLGRDLFHPPSRAVEVWGGFEVTGTLALVTAPLHWAIFAVGAWAFWTGRRWIVPLAAVYLFYVAASHLVWSEVGTHGRGWKIGILQATAIAAVGVLLLRVGRTTDRSQTFG